MLRDDVLALRLATQHLVGPPLPDPVSVVRHLLAVQAQDAPLTNAGVALRCGAAADVVRAALDAGAIVRTHVLRPTWHLVAADDLPWLLDLTSDKVLSGLAGRRRQLGLDDATGSAALDSLTRALADGPLARPALQRRLQRDGVLGECSMLGQQVGHLLLLAELSGTLVSGPVAEGGLGVHTYALAAGRLPAATPRPREEALAELVARFVAGHGPVSVADLQRWVRVTLAEARTALAGAPRLAPVTVGGVELWYDIDVADAAAPHLAAARAATLLLPVFDEAFLSYHDVGWPRLDGHPMGADAHRFAEAGGGVLLSGLRDLGTWKRRQTPERCELTLTLATSASDADRAAVVGAAERFAAVAAPGASAAVVVRQG